MKYRKKPVEIEALRLTEFTDRAKLVYCSTFLDVKIPPVVFDW